MTLDKMNNLNIKTFKTGFKDALPIFLGYFAVSFTLGIAARKIGLSSFQATFMSVTNATSAGQFAALSLISAGATYLELAITQLVVNIRYFLMSCSLSQKIKHDTPLINRLFLAGTLTDEVFALSIAYKGNLNPWYSYGAMAFSVLGWGGGTFFGAVTGGILPPVILSAFGVALYGMFIAIIIPKTIPTRTEGKRNKTGLVTNSNTEFSENRFFAYLISLSMLVSLLFTITPVIKEISNGSRIIILTILIAGIAAFIKPIEEDDTNS